MVGSAEPSGVLTHTPRGGPSPAAAARRTVEIDRATAAVPHPRGPLDVKWRLETPTLRDRQRWSYAPCGLLLALAQRGRFTVGTMMPHGRRSPFHRMEPTRRRSVRSYRRGARLIWNVSQTYNMKELRGLRCRHAFEFVCVH